jgi:DNA/RNA-binding domain of Phe-tRNA-synthetase-like protein
MRNVANPAQHAGLDARKGQLEHELRRRFAGGDRSALKALAPIESYTRYYKRYKKTYHVLFQLEAIALKGKAIPRIAALVEAMFLAELKNFLLTAGHDLQAVQVPVRLEVASGTERYVLLSGQEQTLKPGDMMMIDREGVISSVLYGPDHRTRITPQTRRVFFAVYAPPGIGEQAVSEHLRDLQENVMLVAPQAGIETLHVYGTG